MSDEQPSPLEVLSAFKLSDATEEFEEIKDYLLEHERDSDTRVSVIASKELTVGGAPYEYFLIHPVKGNDPLDLLDNFDLTPILFQNGTIPDVGVNGITIESLLTVCAHRLEGFQSGDYPCDENEEALNAIRKALNALNSRTKKRIAKQVGGKVENH